jgi:RNA-binding protein YhbY
MPAKTYETKDAVPDSQRESAIETKDGKFIVIEDEDTTPLKNSIAATRKERDAAKKKAQELEARLAELEQEVNAGKSGITSDKLAEIRKQAEDKFKTDLEERDRLKAELRSLRLDSSVKSMLAKADVIDPDAAWKILNDEYDLTDDGKPILKADPSADIEKHIASQVKSKYPFLFKGTQASGGGAAGTQKGGAQVGTKPVTQWTVEEKKAYREQHGEDSIQKLLDQHLRDAMKPKAA